MHARALAREGLRDAVADPAGAAARENLLAAEIQFVHRALDPLFHSSVLSGDGRQPCQSCGMPCEPLTSHHQGVAFYPNAAEQPLASIRRNAMTVSIRQLHPHFFGEVSGVDLRKPLTPQEAADIEAGMDKYAVLLFRDQDITDEQQMAFALNFGERENPRGGNIVKPQDSRLDTGLNAVSNLGKDGKPLPRDHRTHLFNLGNFLWHSDSSFRPIPAKFSLLSARGANHKNGNTESTDTRPPYYALDHQPNPQSLPLTSD